MTRKDYILIASHLELALQRGHINVTGLEFVADAFEYDNHRFDRGRFLVACGVEDR